MDDNAESVDLLSGVATPRDSNRDTIQLARGCLTICTLRDTITPPLCGVKVLHPAQMI